MLDTGVNMMKLLYNGSVIKKTIEFRVDKNEIWFLFMLDEILNTRTHAFASEVSDDWIEKVCERFFSFSV